MTLYEVLFWKRPFKNRLAIKIYSQGYSLGPVMSALGNLVSVEDDIQKWT
jgi:hypothetical protein